MRLVLRHAWLNLWDKHMTTGRINQVSRLFMGYCERSEQWAQKRGKLYSLPEQLQTSFELANCPVKTELHWDSTLQNSKICYLATLGPPDNTRLSAIRSLQRNVQKRNENLYCPDSEALQDTTHISSLTDRTLSSALNSRQQAPVNAVFVVEKIFCSVQDSAENRENTVF